MKAVKFFFAVMIFILLSGCAKGANMIQPESADVTDAMVPDNEEYDAWRLTDFPARFSDRYETKKSEYAILRNTSMANSVICLEGKREGPVIYLVCGLHGDEKAAWIAGNLLKEANIRAGAVYILAPANLYGAEHNQRNTKDAFDANRYFPGNHEGSDAEQLDYAIYRDIIDKQPALVIDLHEAVAKPAGGDDLRNTIICEDLSMISDLIWDIMIASERGELFGELTVYGGPPEGSLNRTVTRELGIPTITVETSRNEPLPWRVNNQLELVEFILSHEGLLR